MKKNCLGMLAVLAWFGVSGATIEWESPYDAVAAVDVATEGETVFASNASGTDYTVNGVLFKGASSVAHTDYYALGIVTSAGAGNANGKIWEINTSAFGANKASSDYERMLAGGFFHRYNSTVSLTLKSLQPGEDYLVQIWMSERRYGSESYSDVIDSVCTLQAVPSSGALGQYAIGRFRADAETQTILISSTRSPLVNAMQVRKLSAVRFSDVCWGPVERAGSESEINLSGQTLYAYQFSRYAQTVNGVEFGVFDVTKEYDDVDLSCSPYAPHELRRSNENKLRERVTCQNELCQDNSHPYCWMLANCAYVNRASGQSPIWMDLTLKRLVPGRRYLVQLWYQDARYEGPCQLFQTVDGARSLFAYDPENNNFGSWVSGTFVATATTRTIRIRGRNGSAETNPMLNAFQVRDLSEEGWCERIESGFITDETAIRTEGSLVYASTPGTQDLTVNGVTFKQETSKTAWADGKVALTGFENIRSTDTFFPNPSTPLEHLLAPALYNTQPGVATLTFGGLTPYEPYLIQLIVNDSRDIEGVDTRAFKILNLQEYWRYYQDRTTAKRFGSSVSVVVWPTAERVKLVVAYTGTSPSPQLNALQVRKLDGASGGTLWTGGSSGTWSTEAAGWDGLVGTPWAGQAGLARDARLPDGTTLAVSPGVSVRNIGAVGTATLTGTLPTLAGQIYGGDVTLLAPWQACELGKTTAGRLTLNAPSPALQRIMVAAGTLVIGGDAETMNLTDLVACAPGKIQLTAGATVALDRPSFDLGMVDAINIPVGYSWTSQKACVLRTTGQFTGTLPRLVGSGPSMTLTHVLLDEGGEELHLKLDGFLILLK